MNFSCNGTEIDIQYLNDNCKLSKGTKGALAFDARANISEPIVLKAGMTCTVPLGFRVNTKEESLGLFLFNRSGLSCGNGLTIMNCVGIIDSDYRGEVVAKIWNTGTCNEEFVINPYDRVVQVAFMRAERVVLNEDCVLTETDRGAGGFNSTGVK